jgi:NADPH-dependent 2,4-dienoyl-CoA reductase/sulfur reductase-like enzyme
VVGGNAAGPAAAAKAKRVKPDADVLMFESGDFISTGTCEIPYVLSNKISDYKKIITFTPERLKEEKGVNVFTGCEIIGIDRNKKTVKVYDKRKRREFEEKYDSLILATGSLPKTIADFPEFAINLFSMKNISDLIKISEFINSKKIDSVVIIGSGYIGLEAAEAFRELGKEVIIIEKEKLPLPNAEPEIQMLIFELLKRNNIIFHGGFRKLSVNSENGFIRTLNIDGRIIDTEIVISSTGFYPNNILAKEAGLGLTSKGGIQVDRKLKTTDPNIWACGDNIEIINAVTKKPDYFPVATIAHDFAHIAGENAAGGNAVSNPVLKNIAVKILDKFQVSVGITEKVASENNIPFKSVQGSAPNIVKVMPGSEPVFGKLIYHPLNKNILGAEFFGGREVSGYGNLISAFIQNRTPAHVLGELNYNYTPPLSPLINLLSILGRKIK